MNELWSLLNFIEPSKFASENEFIRYTGGSAGFNDAVASGLYIDYVYDRFRINLKNFIIK